MKNIGIKIVLDGIYIFNYVSDILPGLGDMVKVPKTYSSSSGGGQFTQITETENAGTYMVVSRIFIAENNKVILNVEKIQEML